MATTYKDFSAKKGIIAENGHIHTKGGNHVIIEAADAKSVALAAPEDMAANYTLTLPTTAGTNGQILKTDGTGALSWTDDAGLSYTDLSVGDNAAASGSGNLAYNDKNGTFTYTPPDLSSYLTSVSESDVTQHQAALSITESQISDLQSYLTSVSESDVTQHQTALSITESQISDLQSYLTSVSESDVTQHQTALSITESQISDLGTYVPASEKGVAGGVATLDGSGLVPASQLPSYVDDVLEYAEFADFPATGETGKIYVDIAESDVYRWTGSAYVKVSDAVSSSDQATKLATARNFSLTGDVTATAVSFDGLDNVALATSVPEASVTQHQAALSITESQISDLQSYLTTESDPVFNAHTSSGITNGTGLLKNDGNGNWTYDNSTYLTSYTETDTLDTVTGRGASTTNDITVGSVTTGGTTFKSSTATGTTITSVFPVTSVGAKIILAVDAGSGSRQMSEFLVVTDGSSDVFVTEYATVFTSSEIPSTVTGAINAGNCTVTATFQSSVTATMTAFELT
jgi:hypothetical protein